MNEEHLKQVKSAQNKRYYEKRKDYFKQYRETHKEHICELQREWRAKNREIIRAKNRIWYSETHVRKRNSKYGIPETAGKRVGMFLKAEDKECYEWLKEHFKRQKARKNENQVDGECVLRS